MRSTRQYLSLLLACLFAITSVLACDNAERPRATPPPAVDDTVGYNPRTTNYDYQARETPQPERRSGMSTAKKGAIVLAGAAALYYLYKKHQNKQAATGVDGQYYLSKNGRVYYRDAEHRAHWVTPPPGGITVPADEAAQYSEFQGYDNRPTGRDLRGLAADGY